MIKEFLIFLALVAAGTVGVIALSILLTKLALGIIGA